MTTVPVRWAFDVFGATTRVTLPSPVPELPAVMLIQGTWLAAVHAQESCAEMPIVRVPPAASNESADELNLNAQEAADWVTSTRWSFTTMLPRRTLADGFGATE